MQKSRQRTNRTNIIAVVSLAASLFHSPLHQQANAQQFLSTDEISAIRERAIAGQATQADKQRLYNSLPREDWRRLINLQALSGAIQGAKDYQSLLNTAVRLNGYGDQKVIATVGAIVEAEKVPGDDSYKQGLKYFDDKQYDLAIREFDNAIGRGNTNSYFVWGQAWLQKQNYDQAIADFTEALKTESGNYFLYMNRAAAYAHKGDCASAITDYRRALTLDPDESTKKQISVALKNLNAKR